MTELEGLEDVWSSVVDICNSEGACDPRMERHYTTMRFYYRGVLLGMAYMMRDEELHRLTRQLADSML